MFVIEFEFEFVLWKLLEFNTEKLGSNSILSDSRFYI
jgi:hypothetical protein